MNIDQLYDKIKAGEVTKEKASELLSLSYLKTASEYTLDVQREFRTKIPEIIYGEYKTFEQIIEIAGTFLSKGIIAIVSRYTNNKAIEDYFSGKYPVCSDQNIIVIGKMPEPENCVLVVSGGAADHPVAREADISLRAFGVGSLLYEDRGLAHPTRILDAIKAGIKNKMKAIIVVAGMEGALATFVSSLVPLPVIGVPTSIGYGFKAKESALISMLSSCTPNLAVVNIDGGVRAAVVSALIALG